MPLMSICSGSPSTYHRSSAPIQRHCWCLASTMRAFTKILLRSMTYCLSGAPPAPVQLAVNANKENVAKHNCPNESPKWIGCISMTLPSNYIILDFTHSPDLDPPCAHQQCDTMLHRSKKCETLGQFFESLYVQCSIYRRKRNRTEVWGAVTDSHWREEATILKECVLWWVATQIHNHRLIQERSLSHSKRVMMSSTKDLVKFERNINQSLDGTWTAKLSLRCYELVKSQPSYEV